MATNPARRRKNFRSEAGIRHRPAKRIRQRTAELSRTDGEVKNEIAERERAEAEVERVHIQLMETARHAGMAEVATNVLHNVGNVLNSLNVSATLVAQGLKDSKVSKVT